MSTRINLTINDERSSSDWDRYVQSNPSATLYHRWAWKTVIEKSLDHRTYYLAARSEGRIVGILPLVVLKSRLFGRFMVSMPYFNYGGLLCDHEQAEERLLQSAKEIGEGEKISFIELRHLEQRPALSSTKSHKVTMLLDLQEDEANQWKALGAKLRNQIRKAQKSGLEVHIGHTEYLSDFYHIFSVNMRRLGTPIYSKLFFRTILEEFRSCSNVLVIRHHGNPVAAGIMAGAGTTLEMPWASSIREWNPLCPNTLLYWEALKWAMQHGYQHFDFGRSTPGEGTYKFKEQWGATPVQLYWQYWLRNGTPLPNLSPTNSKYRMAIHLWRRLPLSVTQWLGPQIVKYIP